MTTLFVAAIFMSYCMFYPRMACSRPFPLPSTISTSSRLPPRKSDPSMFAKLHLVFSLTLLLFIVMCFLSFGFRISRHVVTQIEVQEGGEGLQKKYLYWGPRIDCPGKYCVRCGGLGHQESSLRCALEEAMVLNRTFVLPSSMCIAVEHSNTNLPKQSKQQEGLQSRMDTLYDLALMSHRVPVIVSDSKEWQEALVRKHGSFVQVEGIKREELERNSVFQQAYVINRIANRLAWFMECKNRHNRSAITLPYSFLPSIAARPLQAAADLMRKKLKDYDAIHVRRGDKLKLLKDKLSGVVRSMYADLDRDTQPEAIMERIKLWIPAGRTLYIATDEKQAHYFDQLSSKYRVMKAENFSAILEPVVHNNYQLFMVERLVLVGAKTLVKTWKEEPGDLSLSDEAKKKRHRWQHDGTL